MEYGCIMRKNPISSVAFKLQVAFTLSATTAIVAALSVFIIPSAGAEEEAEAKPDMFRVAETQENIHTMLSAWALDNNQMFPNLPLDANTNLRILFQARMMDNEEVFAIPNDGWCEDGKPDGDIGQKPDYYQAVAPGELSYAYVAGYDRNSPSDLPMLIGGAGPAIGWITGVYKKPKVIYRGPVAVTYVGGRSEVETPDEDGKIRKEKDGKKVDIFSAEYGTDPKAIRLPAPVKKIKKPTVEADKKE